MQYLLNVATFYAKSNGLLTILPPELIMEESL